LHDRGGAQADEVRDGTLTGEETPSEAETRFRAAFEYAPIGMALTSLDGIFLRVNRALSAMFGRPMDQLVGTLVADVTHPEDRAADAAAMTRMVRGETANFRAEKRYLHAGGNWVWASLSASIVHDSEGCPRYFVSQMEDVTQRHETELMRRALASMSSGISLIDVREPDQPLVYVNAAFERLTGYPAVELLGRSWKLSEGAETDPETAARLHEAVERGDELRTAVRHHRRDGTAYWSEALMTPVFTEDGDVTHYMSVQKDVTDQIEAAELAAHMAYHDPLTGLPNRTQLQEHVALALARAERKGTAVALLFLDLNHFKQVNDRHGHEIGDRLLEDVARRWRSTARHSDVLARYGGDEFVLLMTDVPRDSARATAVAAATRYAEALKAPFDAHGTPCQAFDIGVSVGIALYPDDATTPAGLLFAADAQMYAGKRAARPAPGS
jgi:diguanylate cyclase (GGDEF)-like protein/PAS domain S-box-containing protein